MEQEHSEHPIFEYNQIDSNVFIGTNACCQMHFKTELLDKGITCDISLEGERIDRPDGVEMYLWLPTPDHTPPSTSQVNLGAATLEEILRQNKKVYIHCQNGHGRAPTFYASYLILKKGLSLEAAIEAIRSKRPSIHLDNEQIEFLKRLK